MPPIHRYEHGIARVPVGLPDDVRWVLDSYYDGFDGDSELIEERWSAIRNLRPIFWYSEEFVAVDAGLLSVVRNVLDEETMGGGSCEDAAEGYGMPAPDDKPCMWCPWCQALFLRDRIDFWLDRSGHEGSVYYRTYIRPNPPYDNPEPDWALVASGDACPSEAA